MQLSVFKSFRKNRESWKDFPSVVKIITFKCWDNFNKNSREYMFISIIWSFTLSNDYIEIYILTQKISKLKKSFSIANEAK